MCAVPQHRARVLLPFCQTKPVSHCLVKTSQAPRASEWHLELPQGNKPTTPASLRSSHDLCQGRLYVQVVRIQLGNSAVCGLSGFGSYLQKNVFVRAFLSSLRRKLFHQLLLSLFFFSVPTVPCTKIKWSKQLYIFNSNPK